MSSKSDSGWDEFLREAVAEGDVELMREAIAQGADPNVAVYDDGHPPLFWAAFSGRVEAVKLLLAAGATVASERDADETSLHTAVENNDLPIVELLLNADGRVALNWFDYIDRTPLMIAVEKGNLEIARRLIAAGADINVHNEKRIGDTALRVAVADGSLEMVVLLVRAGADPNIPGWMGLTPLDKARQRKKPEGRQICELLERTAQEKRGRSA